VLHSLVRANRSLVSGRCRAGASLCNYANNYKQSANACAARQARLRAILQLPVLKETSASPALVVERWCMSSASQLVELVPAEHQGQLHRAVAQARKARNAACRLQLPALMIWHMYCNTH
jgi:hypothetical protein